MIAFLRSRPAAQGIRPNGYPYKHFWNVLAVTATLEAKASQTAAPQSSDAG